MNKEDLRKIGTSDTRLYAAPKLHWFGSVREITRGGSASGSEGGNPRVPKKP